MGGMGLTGPPGPSAFSAITSSTNTVAAMVVGSGATLSVTGTGAITATSLSVFGVPISGVVATSETTTSTSYADLATVGPSATVTVSSSGQKALVTLTARLSNTNANRQCFVAFAVTGATIVAASDAQAVLETTPVANRPVQMSATYLVTGLTSGSNTFTAKYRASNNTCTFVNRNIIVTPF